MRPSACSRYKPAAPLVLAALLTGCRIGELLTLRWENVTLLLADKGDLVVTTTASKTHRERAVDLEESPSLIRLLTALKLRSGGTPYVFGGEDPVPEALPGAIKKRLVKEFGAPPASPGRCSARPASPSWSTLPASTAAAHPTASPCAWGTG